MGVLDHVWLGVVAVFTEAPVATVFGLPISITVVMVVLGFLGGIVVGATPGLGGPFAMAISLPILITIFGFNPDALLPVLGFLIGIMKGATVGGAVPAILFNTPGTPDSLMTTLDGFPMTRKGEAGKALRIAHFSSASGDTFSDLILFTCAPFLAIAVEAHLDFPEKAALIILSLAFISAVVGDSVWKGVLAALFGMFFAFIGTGEDHHPRLSLGSDALAGGLPLISVVLGVLIVGEVFRALEEMWREKRADRRDRGTHGIGGEPPPAARHKAHRTVRGDVGRDRHHGGCPARHRIDPRGDARLRHGTQAAQRRCPVPETARRKASRRPKRPIARCRAPT